MLTVLALALCAVPALANYRYAQDKPKEGPKMSEDEFKQYEKMTKAPNLAEKNKAGIEFIKKFKKTTFRKAITDYLSNQIFNEKDPVQKVQAAQQFIATFDQPGEADLVKPALIDGYVSGGKFDEAFSEGAKYIAANPDDVFVAASLGFNGVLQIQKAGASWKHAKAANDYLTKAVELLEQDKKPERTDKEFWNNYRNSWLPKLYQGQGVLLYTTGEKAKAKELFEKAFGFDPTDVVTLNFLLTLVNEEYMALAQKYQTERKNALMEEALGKMDEVIDYLARAVATTDGKSDQQSQAANGQFKEQLKQYYDFRHPGKTAEMNALVEKYKKK
jgi:tetratricopeptide (TPR) repeat protein